MEPPRPSQLVLSWTPGGQAPAAPSVRELRVRLPGSLVITRRSAGRLAWVALLAEPVRNALQVCARGVQAAPPRPPLNCRLGLNAWEGASTA